MIRPGNKFDQNKKNVARDFQQLIQSGNVGIYNQCEVTTAFLYSKTQKKAYNYFTLVVFEDASSFSRHEEFLTNGQIEINKKFSLGIIKHYESLPVIDEIFQNLLENNFWRMDSKPLEIPKYRLIPKQYLSGNEEIPLNYILKNNFSTGSYLLEFFDENKIISSELKIDNSDNEKIAILIKELIPIDLQFINDRVGNIIFQFPINICEIKYNFIQETDEIKFRFAWHPKINEIPNLIVSYKSELDGSILCHSSVETNHGSECILAAHNTNGEGLVSVINMDNNLLLFSNRGYSIKQFGFNFSISSHHAEPRIFNGNSLQLVFNDPDSRLYHDYINLILDRRYDKEAEHLSKSLELVQYGINDVPETQYIKKFGQPKGRLDDIKKLIDDHGRNGVYLWDPFLDSNDILATLYYCKYSNVPLKAISSYNKQTRMITENEYDKYKFSQKYNLIAYYSLLGKSKNDFIKGSLKKYYRFKISSLSFHIIKKGLDKISDDSFDYHFAKWKKHQADRLVNSGNNLELNLEFRCQFKNVGYQFHDRFLIFPSAEGKPLVWSLGKSINSFGNDHHILQKVPNPMIIQKAFELLWSALEDKTCLVWKSK